MSYFLQKPFLLPENHKSNEGNIVYWIEKLDFCEIDNFRVPLQLSTQPFQVYLNVDVPRLVDMIKTCNSNKKSLGALICSGTHKSAGKEIYERHALQYEKTNPKNQNISYMTVLSKLFSFK